MLIVLGVLIGVVGILALIAIYDRFFQKKNLVKGNYPLIGRFRYIAHELRPFFRQYFGDDDAFAPRIVIDWILDVARGHTGYLSYDKFDTTGKMHDGTRQMIHSPTPLNMDEVSPEYPLVGKGRKHPMQFHSYIYRSAMSLGALSFEGTAAMAAACADIKVPFNTGEGGLSIHHIPRVAFSPERKFFRCKKAPAWGKILLLLAPGERARNYVIDWMGSSVCSKDLRDLYLFDKKHWVFYTINWNAPLEAFLKPEELTDEFGHIILQIGSGLYGLRKKTDDDALVLDWERFKKTASFARAIEVKLAQGAKQTGGILKAAKNTKTIAAIRGVKEGIDLVSQNRFPFYEKGKEAAFLDFCDRLSDEADGKPVGAKIVVSSEKNIEPLAQALSQRPKGSGLNHITIDGGDGGTGAAPIATSVLFGKLVHEALPIVIDALEAHGVRENVRVFAASKLYAPHNSARALAQGADAVGNGRSIMISAGCIRAGRCSGEHGPCPVGLATMEKSKRRSYAQTLEEKIDNVKNYISAHNHELLKIAAIVGVKSPSLLGPEHIMKEK